MMSWNWLVRVQLPALCEAFLFCFFQASCHETLHNGHHSALRYKSSIFLFMRLL